MSLESRYLFLKKMYPTKVILIRKKDRYLSKGIDYLIFNYLNNNINNLKKLKISYILIENLEIIENNNYSNNNYLKYRKLILINKILQKIKFKNHQLTLVNL